MTQSKEKEPAFEELLEQVEATVQRLESGELSLEESLNEYEKGIKALRRCREILEKFEKRIEILMKEDGEIVPKKFEFTETEGKDED